LKRILDQYFNKIFIVESLRENDTKTGSNLYNNYLKSKVDRIQELEAELITPNTKDEFLNFLSGLSKEVKTTDLLPFLHFEIHGDPEGLELGSGETVEWSDIYPLLVDINKQIGNNLLITLAVCWGNYLLRIMKPSQRAPVWGLIGIWEKAWDSDMAFSFKEFFNELLKSLDGDTAVKKLNEANPDKGYSYRFYNCEYLFRIVYKEYLKNHFTEKALDIRINRMYEKARDLTKYKGQNRKTLKRKFKNELLKNRKLGFEKHKEIFFMYDLYPENRNRFIVHYEDVLQEMDRLNN